MKCQGRRWIDGNEYTKKSAGIKADTFILKRNNMDRWIRMDVAMLIILAICTRLVAGIMNVEKMDAYTGIR